MTTDEERVEASYRAAEDALATDCDNRWRDGGMERGFQCTCPGTLTIQRIVDAAIAALDLDAIRGEEREKVAREIREWARNIHPDTAPLETNAQAEKFLGDLAARIARSRSEA